MLLQSGCSHQLFAADEELRCKTVSRFWYQTFFPPLERKAFLGSIFWVPFSSRKNGTVLVTRRVHQAQWNGGISLRPATPQVSETRLDDSMCITAERGQIFGNGSIASGSVCTVQQILFHHRAWSRFVKPEPRMLGTQFEWGYCILISLYPREVICSNNSSWISSSERSFMQSARMIPHEEPRVASCATQVGWDAKRSAVRRASACFLLKASTRSGQFFMREYFSPC
jgi:hypothetical protein